MKKSIILLFIAAATVLLSLCGAFYSGTISPASPVNSTSFTCSVGRDFSLSDAKEYINLCSLAYEEIPLRETLNTMGYSDFCYILRNQSSSHGSGIAFGTGCKKQGDITKVILVFRGTHKGEWYSNFSIGEGVEHSGFSAATDFAEEEIKAYIKSHCTDIKNTEIILTGHSRGGAVANLLAKRLIDEGTYKSVTAYTFASPCTTRSEDAKNSRYKSIYNLLNPEDFICYIPLEKWDYTRYGTDMEFPRNTQDGHNAIYPLMQEEFERLSGYPHTGYPMGASDVRIFLDTAYALAPTIRDYYQKELTVTPHRMTLYDYMTKVAALLCGDSPLQNGLFLMASSSSELFDVMTEFMMEGINIEDVAKSADITTSAISCGHTYETYMAWLTVLNEEYFAQMIP